MTLQTLNTYILVSVPKIHTYILWDLTLLFTILAVVYFFFIFYFRNRFNKIKAERTILKMQLAPMVSEFLFYQYHEGTKEEKDSNLHKKVAIRELIIDKKNRDVPSEILFELKKDVSGDTRKRLFQLYKDLSLNLEAFQKLKSLRLQRISQGMLGLTEMQVLEAYIFMSRFINHKRYLFRKQVKISIVILMQKGISCFLDTTKFQISKWQQLKNLEVLANFDNFQIPRFSNWLTSKNKQVVLFASRLIRHYNQSDSEQAIIALVRHKSAYIKQEAISCIKKFNFETLRSNLKSIFWKSRNVIKLVILDTIGNFQNKEDIHFLEEVDRLDINYTIKNKALSAINTIAPIYVMPIEDLEEAKEFKDEITNSSNSLNIDWNTFETKIDVGVHETPFKESDDFKDITTIKHQIFFERLEKTNALNEILKNNEIDLNDGDVARKDIKEEIIVADFYREIEFVQKEKFDLSETAENDIAGALVPDENRLNDPYNHHQKEENLEIQGRGIIFEEKFEITEVDKEVLTDYQSIFKSLFEMSDDYCKLLLLDEILEIGNQKEITFLDSLHNYHNFEIRKKALFVKAKLQKDLMMVSGKNQLTEQANIIPIQPKADIIREAILQAPITLAETKISVLENNTKDHLQSLEFCFLLEDLKIKPSKPKPFDVFEVEFAIDFREDPATNYSFDADGKENVLETENGPTKEEQSFFHQLLQFPSKLETKLKV